MGIFSNLIQGMGITPRIGLGMIRNEIEKSLNVPITSYTMVYEVKNDVIYFLISVVGEQRKYPFENSKQLSNLLHLHLQNELAELDGELDIVMIFYTKESISVKVYYTDSNNEKQFKIIEV